MKILFFGEESGKYNYIKEKLGKEGYLKKNSFEFFDKELSDKNLKKLKDTEAIVLFIDKEINRRVMRDLPELKFIATMSTGYDHIDTESACDFGICVSNVPVYGANTVAEHTFGLLLNLSRKIWKGVDRVKEDNDFSLEGLRGMDLHGKTIGILGLGNIGRNVAKIAQGFGMKILALDRHPDEGMMKKYGVKYVELDYLLKNSDVVSVHLPLLKETKHFINKENIKNIKRGALLINTARGEIIETGALRWALDEGIIAGAGLDVLEGEEEIHEEIEMLSNKKRFSDWKTLIENHLLIDYDNVIVTPHMAFYSEEAERRILDTTVENVIGFLNRKTCNRVC